MKVVIAEKPSVARDIAKVLKATNKKDGYLEGNGWQVTWAYGHLVGLCEPEAYGWGTPWNKEALPMIPEQFQLQLLTDEQAKSKKDDRYYQQFNIVKNLFKDAEYIVCATDAGREGELIFRNIYNFAKTKTPFKRLWISSLTESSIKKGFDNLKEGTDFDNIYYSAEARAKADWLIGMNATRSLTLANPNKGVFTIGRVQTPTFSFVCNRFYENKNFVQTFYYKLKAKLNTTDKIQFTATCPENFESKESAEKKIESLGNSFKLVKVEKKLVNEKAPLPFSLTDLQRSANKSLGLSAQDTLTALQSLYEAKMTTYPRTDSSYLAEDMVQPISDNIASLNKLNLNKDLAKGLELICKKGIQKNCFDNSKLTDHHAVIPTFENYDNYTNLKDNERKIYDLVVKRFIQSMLPACIKEQVIYTFEAKDSTIFRSSGSTVKDSGWRMTISSLDKEEEKDSDEELQNLPPLMEGEDLAIMNVAAEEKKTKRPNLLTEADLLKLMETAGKLIEDKELSKAIKDCGLGTPATRASVIESLKARQMIEVKDKKYLVPTNRGLAIYDAIKDLDLSKPDVTGEWENKLNKIAEGNYEPSVFLEEIKAKTSSLVTELDLIKITVQEEGNSSKLLTKELHCPICGGKIIEGQKTVRCEEYSQDNPNGCKFVLFKSNKYHTFSEEEIIELCEKKETSKVIVLKTSDKTYNVRFKFDTDNMKVDFIYDNTICDCPKCGKKVVEYKSSYACEGNTKENATCDFLVWKNVSGHELTKDELVKLIANKELKGLSFVSKEGKPYKANLTLQDDFKTKIVFEEEKVCDCPKCGSPVKEFTKGFSCSKRTQENATCDFALWKDVNGYNMTKADFLELLSKKVLKNKSFVSKEGKPYKADLTLTDDFKLKIVFEEKKEIGKCPKCGSPVIAFKSGYKCSNNTKENATCDFLIWESFNGHNLTLSQVQSLLKGEVLKKVKFVSKSGNNYEADVVYNAEANKIEVKMQ
ncbi:MAG: DNA topoisomerase 3 [Paludibacteraceae bacterium]|nr:DNA topoisomerase 3 [Paludibacteraceae bacterium]